MKRNGFSINQILFITEICDSCGEYKENFDMSKKNLLNENTIRRFGGLAGIKPLVTSHFLTEVDVGEEELADALAAGAQAMADELELEVDIQVDSEGGDEELEGELEDEVGGLEDEFGELEGEEDEIDDEEGLIDDEEDALEDEEDALEDEETLDELINRILQEDDDEELTEEEGSKKGEYKRRDKDGKDGKRAGDVDGHYKADETNEGRRGSRGDTGQHTHGRGTGAEDARFEGVQVVDDEYLMQEVAKRVKYRLAQLVKEQRRRKHQTKKRRK